MDDEKKLIAETEDVVANDVIVDASPVEEAPSVTAADVVAAFNIAEQTLLGDTESTEDTSVDEDAVALEADGQNSLIDEILLERNNYVKRFKMDFSLDDIPDAEGMGVGTDEVPTEPVEPQESENEPVLIEETESEESKIVETEESVAVENEDEEEAEVSSKSGGCLMRLIFYMVILIVSVVLATFITTAVFDVTGFSRNNKAADVVIPKGANTEQVASILKEEGLINSELYFRWYVKFMKLDGKWREGSFSLQADMGFPALVNTMQAQPPRKTVKVTFPEGMSVPEMATLLEEKDVCSAESFINAVRYGDFDYDFIRDIPTEADDPAYAYRAYRLEGYLFPDTYEFYVDSQGETVVNRMLQNFEKKITKSMLAQIKDNGWTLDQAVIMASMVQGEGDSPVVMDKVARVMHNRLKPTSGFTLFQFCSTRDYANYLLDLRWDSYDPEALKLAYNTYVREGLPVGAINNPGVDAFNAILYPSNDATVLKCYYFATDYKTGITYFSKTEKEHAVVIKKYGIEDIG